MCNSFNNTSLLLDESMDWFCMCKGHFGPYFTFLSSILCFTMGTPIHCWFFWMLLHGNFKSNLVFPLSITVLELLFCCQSIIDIIAITYPSIWGDHFANFLIGFTWTFRPLLQICVCIEQYLAVIHPVMFLRYKRNMYRMALVTAACLISLGNSLRNIFSGTNYFKDHGFFLFFCIAVIITSFCSVSVLCALKRPAPGHQSNVEITEQDRKRGRAVENKQKRKAFRIIVHILVSILVSYIPLVVIYFINVAKISKFLYLCEIVPLTISFTIMAVLLSTLVRMYSEGHLKHIVFFQNLSR